MQDLQSMDRHPTFHYVKRLGEGMYSRVSLYRIIQNVSTSSIEEKGSDRYEAHKRFFDNYEIHRNLIIKGLIDINDDEPIPESAYGPHVIREVACLNSAHRHWSNFRETFRQTRQLRAPQEQSLALLPDDCPIVHHYGLYRSDVSSDRRWRPGDERGDGSPSGDAPLILRMESFTHGTLADKLDPLLNQSYPFLRHPSFEYQDMMNQPLIARPFGDNLVHYLKVFGIPLSTAVATLESASLCHRDLSPSNLMFRSQEDATTPISVVLIDFGWARPIDQTGSSSPDSSGTHYSGGPCAPWYKAPEILINNANYDPCQVDAWALACLLFEGLTGVPIFAANNELGVMRRIQHLRIDQDMKHKSKLDVAKSLEETIRILVPNIYEGVEDFALVLAEAFTIMHVDRLNPIGILHRLVDIIESLAHQEREGEMVLKE